MNETKQKNIKIEPSLRGMAPVHATLQPSMKVIILTPTASSNPSRSASPTKTRTGDKKVFWPDSINAHEWCLSQGHKARSRISPW